MYSVIYDATCNLCVTFVRLLKQLDGGARFTYVPMQDEAALGQWGITAADCEQGMILIDRTTPTQRWQGTAAAEEIGRLLPMGEAVVAAYRALPGMKPLGDKVYDYVRDNRYALFGRCDADNCRI